jgi:hypothetical protein
VQQDSAERALNKLARTFAAQVETEGGSVGHGGADAARGGGPNLMIAR